MNRLKKCGIAAAVILAVAGVGLLAWQKLKPADLPEGIVGANGRVEANQVEIATKLAGRIIAVVPREGDMVETGSVVARLDQAEIEAQLRQVQAEEQRTRQALATARALLESHKGELVFAEQEASRTAILAEKGYAPNERLDQRRQQMTTAEAVVKAATIQIDEADAAIRSAEAQVDRLKALLADATIKSPIRGRVQYRLVEPGAVLPAGGRIVTLLDLADVSMTIFLPTREAGRLAIGDDARVVLDAAPEYVFPARISFVAAEAQFTPKTVETNDEREKLMFRIKLQASPDMLKGLEERVKSGLRGVGYVRVDRAAKWPAKLAPKLPS
jgi:HlyD family secretion protein